MDEAEARAVLGIDTSTPAAEVRLAFRRGLRRAHPDLAPGDPEAGRATSRLIEAYAVLRRSSPPPPPAPPAHPGPPAPATSRVLVDGDSLTYPGPPDEVFRRLVEVADRLGDITYLDPPARLLDTVVIVDGVACSLLATLQGRANGTEVFFTLEPLGGEPRPPVEPVVAVVAAALAT